MDGPKMIPPVVEGDVQNISLEDTTVGGIDEGGRLLWTGRNRRLSYLRSSAQRFATARESSGPDRP